MDGREKYSGGARRWVSYCVICGLWRKKVSMLDYDFFRRDSINVAEDLLGKILDRKLPDGQVLKARIVETECYRGTFDKGSHAYGGRRTNRNESMYGPAGRKVKGVRYHKLG